MKRKLPAVITIAVTGAAVLMLAACQSSTAAPPLPPPTTTAPPLPAPTTASTHSDRSLSDLMPQDPDYQGLCGASSATEWRGSDEPTNEYSCAWNGSISSAGNYLVGYQFDDGSGYTGQQALADWLNQESAPSSVQQVSDITDCANLDLNSVTCEFPWANSSYPTASGQVGALFGRSVGESDTSAYVGWVIPSEDALFVSSQLVTNPQFGNLQVPTWFLQYVQDI